MRADVKNVEYIACGHAARIGEADSGASHF